MNITVREYNNQDLSSMTAIWNEVVEEGVAFPQEESLTAQTGAEFFAQQSHCGVAEDTDTGNVLGLYILHQQRKLRRGLRSTGTAHRRAFGAGQHRTGAQTGISYPAV